MKLHSKIIVPTLFILFHFTYSFDINHNQANSLVKFIEKVELVSSADLSLENKTALANPLLYHNNCDTLPTILVNCDDGDICTENDVQRVLQADTTVVCIPCAGTPMDCSTVGATMYFSCDDGDPTTFNDKELVLVCNPFVVCVPCSGTMGDCINFPTIEMPCDDGLACTENDVALVLSTDPTIECVPCAGTPLDCSNSPTMMVACDDGDGLTLNDLQIVLSCDNSVICVPCAGTPGDCSNLTTIQIACDDGDPCTFSDMQTVLAADTTVVCLPCTGTPSFNGVTTSFSGDTLMARGTELKYQWLDCLDNFSPIDGASNSYYVPTSGGEYAVEYSNSNCLGTSDCITVSLVNTEDIINLFPNPATNHVEIELNDQNDFPIQLEVFDLNGKRVFEDNLKSQKFTLDTSEFSQGVYFLSFKNDTSRRVLKLLKQ